MDFNNELSENQTPICNKKFSDVPYIDIPDERQINLLSDLNNKTKIKRKKFEDLVNGNISIQHYNNNDMLLYSKTAKNSNNLTNRQGWIQPIFKDS